MLDARFLSAYDEVPNQRSADFADLDMKEMSNGYVFDGIAAVFDEVTDLGEFTEETRRGSYRRLLASGVNVPFLHEHHPHNLLATTKSGRLRLVEEARGLRTMANVVKTDLSERVKALVDSGDITGMSTGFVVGNGNSKFENRGGKPHRIITNFKRLIDVCTTFDPAYATTEAQFRSLATAVPQHADSLQQLLTGVYPQLEEQGNEQEDSLPVEGEAEPTETRADTPLLAARNRRLRLLTITLEGDKP